MILGDKHVKPPLTTKRRHYPFRTYARVWINRVRIGGLKNKYIEWVSKELKLEQQELKTSHPRTSNTGRKPPLTANKEAAEGKKKTLTSSSTYYLNPEKLVGSSWSGEMEGLFLLLSRFVLFQVGIYLMFILSYQLATIGIGRLNRFDFDPILWMTWSGFTLSEERRWFCCAFIQCPKPDTDHVSRLVMQSPVLGRDRKRQASIHLKISSIWFWNSIM